MTQHNRPLQVVVCGTNFGRIYLKGASMRPDIFQLAGILSRGSKQSRECAAQYQVKLYQSVEELDPKTVDLVCIAIKSAVTGGQGTQIAMACLEKGIDVLQEQPVHDQDLSKCYRLALKNYCHYLVNGFYPNIDAGQTFINYARRILTIARPLYLDAECSMQVLYPLVDLIGQALGGLSSWQIKKISSRSDTVLTCLEGNIKDIPLTLRVENRIVPADPDNYALLFHSVTLATDHGRLRLIHTNGMVLWEPRFYMPHTSEGVLDLDGESEFSQLPVSELINHHGATNTYQQIYNKIWPAGIAKAIETMIALKKQPLDRQLMQYQINVCQMWKDIGSQLGPATPIEADPFTPLTIIDIEG